MKSFLPAVVAFGAFVFVVVLAPRVRDIKSPATLVCAAGVGVYVARLAVSTATADEIAFWPFTALFWFLFLIFLVFFLVVYRSVSLRLLSELLDRPGHREAYDALLDDYLRLETLEARLGLLIETGNAGRTEAGLQLTDRGRRNGRFVATLQRLFRIEFSG